MLQSELGPSDFAIFFLLSILSELTSVWPVFGFIFSTRDLPRNLRIWWRVRTTSDDVIFTSNVPSHQVAIYWILKIRFFLSVITSPIFFSKVRLIPDSARSDLSKEPIKSGYLCKNAKKKVSRENRSQASGQLYKDSDVGNLRRIKYFSDYCRPLRNIAS